MVHKLGAISILFLILSPIYALATPGTAIVNFDGTPVSINYDATNVIVNNIDLDLDFISLIIDVDVTGSPGILEITFERNFFDSLFEGQDDPFIIVADGDEPNFEEIETTSSSRTLRIELPLGTDEVEVIGTEFGDLTEPEPPVEEPEPPVEEPEPPVEEPEPPVEEPEPPVEEPETPMEKPEDTTPKTTCGSGTVLRDGICVLEERCGSGTVLQDGVCVLLPAETESTRGLGFDLVYAAVAAFIIAFGVIIVLYIIGRGSRTSN